MEIASLVSASTATAENLCEEHLHTTIDKGVNLDDKHSYQLVSGYNLDIMWCPVPLAIMSRLFLCIDGVIGLEGV